MRRKILVLGGYGNFGKLICEYLSQRSDIELIVAGRDTRKADMLCKSLIAAGARSLLSSLAIDLNSYTFQRRLSELNPYLVIHTSGPFQGQDYKVPNACIESGCHYIDLADDRRFVSDFSTLDGLAKEKRIIAVSGASSVPGLSSVVIDHFANEFSKLEEIEFAIVPGSNVDLGKATIKGILSYVGHPFKTWEGGRYTERYGWMDIRHVDFGEILGKRWLANVNIPDLELFPARYQGVLSVRFQAGHELGIVHLTLNLMAHISKLGLVTHWEQFSSHIYKLAQQIKKLGSDSGGMVIQLIGTNKEGVRQQTIWRLIANGGVGPRIPTISALLLANQILEGKLTESGARPCLGMYPLDNFLRIARNWGIYEEVERVFG